MSMDVTGKRPAGDILGTAAPINDSKDAAAQPALDPTSAAFAQRLAQRRLVKEAFELSGAQDGVEGKASPKTTPKSKLDTNPYAPSAETLHKVATRADAGPVLPPPPAHVRPMTPAARRTFADHFAMRGPQAAAAAAATAGGAAVGLASAEAVRAAMVEGAKTPEGLTPKEASFVKQLVGKAPPAQPFTAATEAELKAAKPPTYGAASSHDSYQALSAAATTYVPWMQFYVTLGKKQQADLAIWLLQRQKLQLLSASITITMLEADKKLTQNTVAMERAETLIKFMIANEQVKNSLTVGAAKNLMNADFSVMRSAIDLGKGGSRVEDRGPTQDLHRIDFLRRVFTSQTGNAATTHAHYIPSEGTLGLKKSVVTSSMTVPPPPGSASTELVHLQRSILSDKEVAALNQTTRDQYTHAMKDLEATGASDLPLMVGLYTHEAGICRAAATRYEAIAAAPQTTPEAKTKALTGAKDWHERADDLEAKCKPLQDKLQAETKLLMLDENRYGDLLRRRGVLAQKRREATAQLQDQIAPVTEEQRGHLERTALNIDLRCIVLDRELARFSNPKEDNRLRRWHTGAKNIADGFYLAHLEKKDTSKDLPSLRWDTMTSVAPVGAVGVNAAYIEAIETLKNGGNLGAMHGGRPFEGIDRTQMLLHIADRRDALKRFGGRDEEGRVVSAHPNPQVRAFHADEAQHLEAAENFIRSSTLFVGQTQPKSVAGPLSISAIGPKITPRFMARAPVTFKDTRAELHGVGPADMPPHDIALDPAKVAKFYRDKADAGAAIMGADSDSHAAAYQNRAFEKLNLVANAAQYINFDAMDKAAAESAMGNTQDIIGESAADFGEMFSLMAQERRMIQSSIEQMISDTYHVPT